jgi:hypothetical protein
MRPALPLILLLAFAAPAVHGFESVDTIPWPSRGAFPAYDAEPTRPTHLWVQGGVMRDDNLLRRQIGAESDTVTRLGAGLRHEARIVGRQRVVLDARGDFYNFDRFSQLDHFAYSVLGRWNWEVGNDLAGTLLVGRDRRQADLAETLAPVRELVTLTRAGATAGYLVTPRWRVRGGLALARGDRTTRPDVEIRTWSWTAGTDYVTALGNSVGVEYRRTRATAPTTEFIDPAGVFVDNDADEDEMSLVATYRPGAMLRTEWRVGRTQRQYTELPGRDFSGTTYRASVEWLPGVKTLLGFEAYREPRSILDIAASHVVVTGLAFGPSWAVTNKLVLSARLVRERREFEGSPQLVLVPGTVLRSELIHVRRLALGWEPLRNWQVSMAIDDGERDSNIFGRSYRFTAYTANVAWRY